jgi:hypothetical protein
MHTGIGVDRQGAPGMECSSPVTVTSELTRAMAKLHELLAAEKTRTGSWNAMHADTLSKFKKSAHYFDGHSRRLQMLEDSPANRAIEAGQVENKPVITTVYETLKDALDVFAKAEDLQFQKNLTKHRAAGTVMWQGEAYLKDVPIDQLLGLESRITKLRELWETIPTQDATRTWTHNPDMGTGVYEASLEETEKTEKQAVPVTLAQPTKEHPAQVQLISKDVTVGRFTTQRRTGAATAQQKYDALKQIDDLLVEIKAARQRANETPAEDGRLGHKLAELLLEPFIP